MKKFTKAVRILLVVLVVLIVVAHTQALQRHSGRNQQKQQQEEQLVKRQRQKVKPNRIQGSNNNDVSDDGVVPIKANKKKKNQKETAEPVKYKKITKLIPDLGRVRGRIIRSQWSGKKIMQFLDIPYGASTSGPLRFKPSVPAKPWHGILKAYKPHIGCPSLEDMHIIPMLEEKNIDAEDCLRLTINSKNLSASAPVMVYIHGDFLYDGNSKEAAPGYLLEEDVVLVAVRYRLGPFGFLSTRSEDIPGNAAVHDVILALKWIQNYIYSFGGDPKRVTLFGQVGGSALINVLTMSPIVPAGLFHRVIYHAASAISPAFITDKPLPAARDIARIAGCKQPNKIEGINRCMRNLNVSTILEAFNAHGNAKATLGVGSYGAVQFVIGGPSGVLPEHPGTLMTEGRINAYPTLGGTIKHAGSFLLKDIYIDNFNETIVDDQLDGLGYIDYIITQTNGADPSNTWKKFAQEEIFRPADIKNGSFYNMIPGLIDLCSTIAFKNPLLLAMQANARKLPNDTYLYSFDYVGEFNRYDANDEEDEITGGMPFELGASLTDESLYLFPWPRDRFLNTQRDIKIAKRMIALWTSFATTGVPKAPGIPAWPAMTDETGPYMKIGDRVSFGDNYLDEYSIAVKDSQFGYNLVNDEFFESLVDIPAGGEEGDKENADGDDDDDDDDEDDENGNVASEVQSNKGRAKQPHVWIAQKTKRNFI